MNTAAKRLFYVPLIHMSVDLGSIGAEVSKRVVAGLGEEVWSKHIETINGFWQSLAVFFDSMDASGMKIYQDGLFAGGELGKKLVEEGARKGSKNHEIVLNLLEKGATLVGTEDLSLLKKEYGLLVDISGAASPFKKLRTYLKYRFLKNGLLRKRDMFIAGRINETLLQGDTGILFVGAYHEVIPNLSSDIRVIEVKDREKIRAYQRRFLYPSRYKDEIEALSGYLVSAVDIASDNALERYLC